ATDVGVWRSHGWAWPEQVLCISHVQELDGCERTGDTLRIGAGCSWRAVRDAVAEPFPEYAEILDRFGSPQIRELGTAGGNLANGSPIADSLPALFAMDAAIELASASRGARSVPIPEFYTGYKQTVMAPDELITAVHLPLPQANDRVHLEKTSKRRDMDISTFTAAIRVTLDDVGQRIEHAAVALGGVGPVVVRCKAAEQRLRGAPFDLASFREAGKLAREAVTPISDVRGGADYRFQLTENVFLKAFHGWAMGVTA
ncbi:MAG: FAD binding domain-containing protein, partial [Planctomycetota bacterium]